MVEPYNASILPTVLFEQSGKGRHIRMCMCVRVFPVFHVAHGRKTLQTYGFPPQTYGKTLGGHISNSKA